MNELECPPDNPLPCGTQRNNQPDLASDDSDEEDGPVLHIKYDIKIRELKELLHQLEQNLEKEKDENKDLRKRLVHSTKPNAQGPRIENKEESRSPNINAMPDKLHHGGTEEKLLHRVKVKEAGQKNESSGDVIRAELTSKKDEIQNLESLLKMLEEERNEFNTSYETLVARLKELENCLKDKEASNAALESELAASRDDVRYLKVSLDKISIERDNFKTKAQRVNELLSKHDRLGNDYQEQIDHDLQEKDAKIHQLTSCIETLKLEKVALVKERDDVKRAKEDALTRLSKAAGAKLTHGNAAITDLSDDNRPTKIAEKFSEIYDNLWTDAFEELAEVGQHDLTVIDTLLQILKNSFKMCMEREQSYDASITEAVHCIPGAQQGPSDGSESLHTKIPRYVQIRKAIVDIKLALGPAAGRNIAEDYISQVEKILQQSIPNFSCSTFPKTAEFSRQCTILCWLMRIRDPSVHVDFNFTKGGKFNSDLYRQYTKSGTVANYLVWPILYLQEGGPMLAKGVAQPE